MNRIIESFLETHRKEYNLTGYTIERSFEHFINRLIVNKYIAERFDPSDIMQDEGERGLDGIAIIVNDKLITSLDEFNEENKKNELTVRFVFIQTKTSNYFSSAEIGNFTRATKSFFLPPDERQKTNQKIEDLIQIKDEIYRSSIKFCKNKAPVVEMYYACCGTWNPENGLQRDIEIDIKTLKESHDFSVVSFIPFDSDKINISYKELKKRITRIISMEKRISLPKIPGITQSYLGVVKCKDFIQLLTGSDGNMLSNIFEDNVRDFQGYNSVNSEIQSTVKDPTDQERFAVLNNGITIIAKRITTIADTVELFDYQIVNGCQTSYVLFENTKDISENSYIVLKIIEVSDENILDRIIFTTNRQTEVKAEAFTATKMFHKRLQDFYNAVTKNGIRLFYERRSKQYDLVDEVDKNCVVTLANQVRNYVAMFLNEPHSIHRYYGELLDNYRNRLFLEEDLFDLYYLSSYFSYFVDDAFKKRKSSSVSLKKEFKFHIILAMRVNLVGPDVFFGKPKKQKQFSDILFKAIEDTAQMQRSFQIAVMCVEKAIEQVKANGISVDLHRRREVTQEIISNVLSVTQAQQNSSFLKPGDIVHCTVIGVDKSYVNVQIKTEDSRNNGSIHISQMSNQRIDNLRMHVKIGDIFQAKILQESEYDKQWGWALSKLIS